MTVAGFIVVNSSKYEEIIIKDTKQNVIEVTIKNPASYSYSKYHPKTSLQGQTENGKARVKKNNLKLLLLVY